MKDSAIVVSIGRRDPAPTSRPDLLPRRNPGHEPACLPRQHNEHGLSNVLGQLGVAHLPQ